MCNANRLVAYLSKQSTCVCVCFRLSWLYRRMLELCCNTDSLPWITARSKKVFYTSAAVTVPFATLLRFLSILYRSFTCSAFIHYAAARLNRLDDTHFMTSSVRSICALCLSGFLLIVSAYLCSSIMASESIRREINCCEHNMCAYRLRRC